MPEGVEHFAEEDTAHTVAHTHQTQQRTRVLRLYKRIIKETQAMSFYT
jgi:hypothetical protein